MTKSFGPYAVPVVLSTESTTIAIASTATIYTKAVSAAFLVALSLDYIFTSSGTVDVKIELEQGNALPTTEGSSDTGWTVGEGVSDIGTIADEVQHFKVVAPVVTKFFRLKLTGGASNDASTTLAASWLRTEEL